MKKVLTVCLVLVMIVAMSVQVFAEPGAFINSPSKNKAPVLISGASESEACLAQIIITAYADRNDLSPEERKAIEEAYADIVGAKTLDELHHALDEIAVGLGVNVGDLAVSDLFNISATGCTASHNTHGAFDITLAADTLANYVCLLRYYDGAWHIVEGAKINEDGHLVFESDVDSPFAIVVSTTEIVVDEQTGDQTGDETGDQTGDQTGNNDGNTGAVVATVAGIVALVVAIAIAAAILLKKKKNN